MKTEKKWYVIYTKQRCEKKISEALKKRNIENYCPVNKVVHQWADRKKVIDEPLFERYVFVRSTEIEHSLIKQIENVMHIVYWLGKPAVVRDNEIEDLKNFLEKHGQVIVEKIPVRLNDHVKITNGAFNEHSGRITEINNKTVKVSLHSLGYSVSAVVNKADVRVTAIPSQQSKVVSIKYHNAKAK